MIPDFLAKQGITTVRDNLTPEQTVAPPIELFARLLTEEFLEVVEHGVSKHHAASNERSTEQIDDSRDSRCIKRYAVSARRKRRVNVKSWPETLSHTK